MGDPTTDKDSENCTMAVGAMALDFQTGGRIQVWGGELRKHQSDQTGGTDLGDVGRAWRYYGETLDERNRNTWRDATDELRAGNPVLAQGDYDQFTGANSCQPTFLGDHCVLVLPESRMAAGRLQWLTADPLCAGFGWRDAVVLQRYAEKLGRAQIGVNESRQPIFMAVAHQSLPDTSTGDAMSVTKYDRIERSGTLTAPAGATLRGLEDDDDNGWRVAVTITASAQSSTRYSHRLIRRSGTLTPSTLVLVDKPGTKLHGLWVTTAGNAIVDDPPNVPAPATHTYSFTVDGKAVWSKTQ
jgi:hypothetical protein